MRLNINPDVPTHMMTRSIKIGLKTFYIISSCITVQEASASTTSKKKKTNRDATLTLLTIMTLLSIKQFANTTVEKKKT
jgi:hypothetical protein